MNKFRIDKVRVMALMERKGWTTLHELSAASGVHVNTLSVITRGGNWNARTAEKIADALGCNPVDMFVADGYPQPFLDAQGSR